MAMYLKLDGVVYFRGSLEDCLRYAQDLVGCIVHQGPGEFVGNEHSGRTLATFWGCSRVRNAGMFKPSPGFGDVSAWFSVYPTTSFDYILWCGAGQLGAHRISEEVRALDEQYRADYPQHFDAREWLPGAVGVAA